MKMKSEDTVKHGKQMLSRLTYLNFTCNITVNLAQLPYQNSLQ
jgi:hypothetical protein